MMALREGLDWLPTSFPLAAAAVAAVILAIVINTLATPKRADPREPPLLKPTIPFIGYIIGLIRHQADYHRILHCKSKQPIVTLPMLNGKLYAIFDPSLISAGLKNKHLSTKPQVREAVAPLMQVTKSTADLMRREERDELKDRIILYTIPTSFLGEL